MTVATRKPADQVRLVTVNHHGQFVGRALAVGAEGQPADLRTSVRDYLLANDLNHHEIRPHGADHAQPWFSGYGSVVLVADPDAPPRTADPFAGFLQFADVFDTTGRPVPVASRAVLRHVVQRLEALGLRARVATELEFYLVPPNFADLGEAELGSYFSGIGPGGDGLIEYDETDAEVIRDILESCAAAGIATEGYSQETGRGQYEINFRPGDPMSSCDDHVLFKHLARTIARRHGRLATFMAKPASAAFGSSCHVNASFEDAGDVVDPAPAAAGLVAHLPALAVLLLPYANSYRRLRPGGSLSRLAVGDDRSTAVRVVDGRLEARVAGADANPYLAVAAVLAASLAGLTVDPVADANGAPEMPLSLAEAIGRATDDSPGWEILPEPLRAHATEVAALEMETDRRHVTSFDRLRLLSRI